MVLDIDETNREILLFIIRGHSSPYSIWSAMNKETQGKGMAYINIRKRVRYMLEKGLLQTIEIDDTTGVRGRKDYRVSMECLEHLMPYFLSHPGYTKIITGYIDRSGLDRNAFEKLLKTNIISTLAAANLYYESLNKKLIIPYGLIPNIQMEKPLSRLQKTKTKGQTKGMKALSYEDMKDMILTEEAIDAFRTVAA